MNAKYVKYYIKAQVDCPDPSVISLEDSRIGAIFPQFALVSNLEWLECNGQAVSRMVYPVLYAIIGTRFGQGDGSSTFNLPALSTSTYLA